MKPTGGLAVAIEWACDDDTADVHLQFINDLKAVDIVATELTYFLIEEKDYPDVFGDKFKGFKIVAEATLGVAKGYRGATSEVNVQIPSTVLAQRRRLMLHTTTPPLKWEHRNPHQPKAKRPRKRGVCFFEDKRNGKRCRDGSACDFKHLNTMYEPSWRPVQFHCLQIKRYCLFLLFKLLLCQGISSSHSVVLNDGALTATGGRRLIAVGCGAVGAQRRAHRLHGVGERQAFTCHAY